MADLPKRMRFDGFHELGEEVAAFAGGVLQQGEVVGLERVARLFEGGEVGDLLLLFFFGGTDQLDVGGDVAAVLGEEGVDADQRQ